MKLDQLRKIIREEVRAAIKDELSEVLTEAVKIASEPSQMKPAPQPGTSDWSAAKKPSRQDLAELIGLPPTPKPTNLEFGKKGDPISEMLNMTQKQMTPEEYSNVVGGTGAVKPNFASQQAANMGMTSVEGMQGDLDISQLSFVKKAKSVLDLANKKSSGVLN